MSYFINNQQKVNEIIFAERNKNYGAYVLRSHYGQTLFISLGFVMLGIGILTSIGYYFSNHNDGSNPNNTGQILDDQKIYVISCPINAIEPAEKNITKSSESKPTPNNQNQLSTNVVIVDSLIDDLTTSSKTIEADSSNIMANSNAGVENSTLSLTGDETTNIKKPVQKSIKKDIEVDSPPEFEGGLSALYHFISKNLKYPVDAIEANEQGIVRVNFVVDENGEIGDLTLLNKKGFGLDEEALRVVKLIPKFKTPAKVKGEAVKVYYQLPIKFKLQ